MPRSSGTPSHRGNYLEAQDLRAARRRCHEDVGMVQTSLMVSHDHLAFAASEHERRACGPASQGGVLREVVRRNHDTGIAPPEHPDLVVQIFEGLRIPGRVALATSQRLGDPVLGLRVPEPLRGRERYAPRYAKTFEYL